MQIHNYAAAPAANAVYTAPETHMGVWQSSVTEAWAGPEVWVACDLKTPAV